MKDKTVIKNMVKRFGSVEGACEALRRHSEYERERIKIERKDWARINDMLSHDGRVAIVKLKKGGGYRIISAGSWQITIPYNFKNPEAVKAALSVKHTKKNGYGRG